jgi:hypothetical protein
MLLRMAACVLLWLSLPSFAQTVVTVPVTDNSAPGSPLQVNGTVTFTDQLFGNSVVSSSRYELTATNVSGKGIVFLLVRLDGSGSHGGGILHSFEWENFFSNEGIAPEQNFVLARSTGGRQISCCINPLESAGSPKAEINVIYSEFTDGSTYGDKREGAHILATRSFVIERLRQLDAVKGDDNFVRLLAQKLTSDEADGFLEFVRSVQKRGGTQAARAYVRRDLGNAARHLAAMQAAVAESN